MRASRSAPEPAASHAQRRVNCPRENARATPAGNMGPGRPAKPLRARDGEARDEHEPNPDICILGQKIDLSDAVLGDQGTSVPRAASLRQSKDRISLE